MKGSSIRCPYCSHGKNRITRTMRITVMKETHVRRYRKCLKCDMSFRTREVLDEVETDATAPNLKRTDEDREADRRPHDEDAKGGSFSRGGKGAD